MFSERKEELSINVPIACGGVVVRPGDFVVADTIGVTVVPRDKAGEVLELAREQAEREQKTREWVAKGKTSRICCASSAASETSGTVHADPGYGETAERRGTSYRRTWV